VVSLVDRRIASFNSIAIASSPIQNWLSRNTKGIAYTGVNIETLKLLSLPLPPLAEQQRIVAEVERRLSVIEQMETTIQHSLDRAERLRQAILKRAFEGKLVPQDPNDEPASVLLERIRAERAEQAGNDKPGRRRRRKKTLAGQTSFLDAGEESST
jgi:type I restriction enzyme, S subunit